MAGNGMAGDSLDPRRTCLLFFDTSTFFVNGPTLKPEGRSPAASAAVQNWQRQLATARDLGMMVAHAQTENRPDGADYYRRWTDTDLRGNPFSQPGTRLSIGRHIMGTPDVAVIDELALREDDYVFAKPRWDPFFQTTFELALRLRGIDMIVVNGGSTEVGITATVYGAQARDFDLVVVSDGCTSRHPDCHDLLMKHIFPRIGRVRTTDQVISMLKAAQQ